MSLTFKEYQEGTAKTAIYPEEKALEYTALGLAGEAGEIANKVKKMIRGDKMDGVQAIIALADELGDLMWYVSEFASTLGADLETVATRNLEKLRVRQEQGTLQGSGDVR